MRYLDVRGRADGAGRAAPRPPPGRGLRHGDRRGGGRIPARRRAPRIFDFEREGAELVAHGAVPEDAGLAASAAGADLLAHSVLGYAVERLRVPKDTHWGARPAAELEAVLAGMLSAEGVGGHEALRVFRDVLVPACRPMDDPMMLSYVPTAPTFAATLFDLVVSASSIFAGHWESGAGAIAAENQALAWLGELAGYPPDAGGCFVSGGSAANLSALVTGRHHALARQERTDRPRRWASRRRVRSTHRCRRRRG